MIDIFCLHQMEDFVFPKPLCQNDIIHIAPAEMDVLLAALSQADTSFSPLCSKNLVSGGTAANILKAASVLGARCIFYGAAGKKNGERDNNSLFFQNELSHYGIQSVLTIEEEPTGQFLIVTTPDGRFAGAASPAAARKITLRHADEQAIKNADFAVLEGMICLNDAVFSRVIALCRTHGVMPIIDAASPFAAEKVPAGVQQIVAADLPFMLFANEAESTAIEHSSGISFAQFAQQLCKANPKTIVVKKIGARGTHAWSGTLFIESPVQPVCAVDATGAGDVFAGAFLSAYDRLYHKNTNPQKVPMSEQTLRQALDFAGRAASCVLDTYGCRFEPSRLRAI